MRYAQRIGDPLLPSVGNLMFQRRTNHAVASMEERVHVRAAERGGARCAGAPELGAANQTERHIARGRHASVARNRRVVELVVGDTVGGVLAARVQTAV